MTEKEEHLLAKANLFFERAGKVAETDNFDYAIDLYLEGLRCAPEQLELGHIGLYSLALNRLAKKAKKPSVAEKIRKMRGKTPLDQMLNAEYLLAKDPHHLPYAEAMLKAAVAGGYKTTARWIADLLFQGNTAAAKPSLQTYILLKNSYLAVGQLERAVIALQYATKLKPDDGDLASEYKNLSAEMAVDTGKYDLEGDFRHSIKDRQQQEKLQAQQSIVKTPDFRTYAVEKARKTLAKNPALHENIFNLARALADLETENTDAEAIELLSDAAESKNDFSFLQLAGEIKIKQLKRKIKHAKNETKTHPADELVNSNLAELSEKLKNTELEHYRLCMVNYPTDLRIKYEYAVRLFQKQLYDEAIPLFQDAQRDPRCKIAAMDKIGLCFFEKGWFADAVDIFTKTIDSYEIKDDAVAKELQYNLARASEENGDSEKALKLYRKVAQLDFAYKDVKQRIDKLRNK